MSVVQEVDIIKHKGLHTLHEAALLANEGSLECKGDVWCAHGDTVDAALLVMAKKSGLTKDALTKDYQHVGDIPYESQQKFSASIFKKNPF